MCKVTTTSVIKTPNQIEHVSTEGGIIHELIMQFRSVFLSHIFEEIWRVVVVVSLWQLFPTECTQHSSQK